MANSVKARPPSSIDIRFDESIFRQLSEDSRIFLSNFRLQHGRGPRVAHLGNIANNAYHAAKMMRAVGVDGDVIALHDYFVMSSPEWEEAEVREVPAELFNPAWHEVDLGGYERPRWYVQGPVDLCLDYVAARNRGDTRAADLLWNRLAIENRTRSRAAGRKPFPVESQIARQLSRLSSLSRRVWNRGQTHLRQAVSSPEYWPRLETAWKREFPDREDPLRKTDLMWGAHYLRRWSEALKTYDFVLGYSTYGLFPLLCNVPYLCFEHGTLRDIPFENNAQGRSTALSYRLAKHTFVTNFDCVPNAEILCPGRFTYINHPYSQDHAQPVHGVSALRAELCAELNAEFLVFFPTRHDWVHGTGYADKGNDVLLRAASRLAAAGRRLGLVLCAWGQNVSESRALISELGLLKFVRWIPPASALVYNRYCQACDLVADQFKLGAFGGVLYKALCNKAPVLSYLNDSLMAKVYAKMPPILNGRTIDELEALLIHASENPAAMRALGNAGRQWVDQYHDGTQTLDRMLQAFGANWKEQQQRALPA